jgi:hypothetical protein
MRVGQLSISASAMVEHIVLAHEAGGGGDRHGLHKGHGERFEQEGEAGAGSRPGDGDLLDAAVGAGDARGARVQEGLMLEEVEVAPFLPGGVVHRAVGLAAGRAGEAAASGEVDLDVEATLVGVEGAGLDQPGRHQAQSELHEIDVAHGPLLRPVCTHGAAVLASVKDKRLRRGAQARHP